MYTYLVTTSGPHSGNTYFLDGDRENRLGRGLECDVVLSDPLCSRVHATILRVNNQWQIRDGRSLNGTLIDGKLEREAILQPGTSIRIGGSDFRFEQSEHAPTAANSENSLVRETLVSELPVGLNAALGMSALALPDKDHAKDLLLLYQLSLRLMTTSEPQEVTQIALELLKERTGASLVGYLWVDDNGKLRAQQVIPAGAEKTIVLSKSLSDVLLQEKHAVWTSKGRRPTVNAELKHFADALCVPLVSSGRTVGAIHAYLDRGSFRQIHFDFAISLANITAQALVRSRRDVALANDFNRLVEITSGFDELIGDSPPIRELKQKIQRLAQAAGCVLIRGESGVGKELVARALHSASPRYDRPMLSVNCAAIPGELMESQLFGHKAGAFTGADRDHVGYFQQADTGSLFLDELGEMSLAGQAKLLRVLEGHPFLPVGGTKEISVDVRVIAATNRDLQSYVREKKFREDLFYRLCVFELIVPPLRERGEDIDLLVDFFLAKFRKQHARPGLQLSQGARKRLREYAWPGNVRQLRNVIDSAVVLTAGEEITPNDLGLRDTGLAPSDFDTLRLDQWEQRLIVEALRRTRDNIPESARLLGLGRATLYRKIDEYKIERDSAR